MTDYMNVWLRAWLIAERSASSHGAYRSPSSLLLSPPPALVLLAPLPRLSSLNDRSLAAWFRNLALRSAGSPPGLASKETDGELGNELGRGRFVAIRRASEMVCDGVAGRSAPRTAQPASCADTHRLLLHPIHQLIHLLLPPLPFHPLIKPTPQISPLQPPQIPLPNLLARPIHPLMQPTRKVRRLEEAGVEAFHGGRGGRGEGW